MSTATELGGNHMTNFAAQFYFTGYYFFTEEK